MSRIGKQPIPIPDKVTVIMTGVVATIKGPLGEITVPVHRTITVNIENNQVLCTIAKNTKQSPAHWGTTRSNINNAIIGVTVGFKKDLEIQGVGFKANVTGQDLNLALGYSHPIKVTAPEGIKFSVDKEIITIEGIDKILVGQVAADIRKLRKPEPYKGKGIRYVGEQVRRKVGKVVAAVGE
jgi:large subunit ribosomal protein L6